MTKDLCSADFQREQHISFLPMGMLTIQTHGRIIHYQKDGIDLTENIEISQFLGPTNFYYRLNTLFKTCVF